MKQKVTLRVWSHEVVFQQLLAVRMSLPMGILPVRVIIWRLTRGQSAITHRCVRPPF